MVLRVRVALRSLSPFHVELICTGLSWVLKYLQIKKKRQIKHSVFNDFSTCLHSRTEMRLHQKLSNSLIFKLADRMRSMRTNGASKNPDWCRVFSQFFVVLHLCFFAFVSFCYFLFLSVSFWFFYPYTRDSRRMSYEPIKK